MARNESYEEEGNTMKKTLFTIVLALCMVLMNLIIKGLRENIRKH